ncbi:hypothetical protein C8J57DRAFT_1265861 [Mycena rebaudengoi]|nr:hypothetical protein C8J57DRAFT_1265861 [Mycena rebaudengoi]
MLTAYPLPTLDKLGAVVPPDIDIDKTAADWIAAFASSVESCDVTSIVSLFVDESHWRDMLALTWDFRSIHGAAAIRKLLTDRLASAGVAKITIKPQTPALQTPAPDLAWISIMFDFETHIGLCSGIVRLVPTSAGAWKAHCMYTNLEDLKGHPELIGALRDESPNHGKWATERARSLAFENEDPVVLIIGGGHSGLEVAARLKYLGVRTLVVEKDARIGDNWRNRYDGLCLHNPVWFDHLAYLPFPPTWPMYTPAHKLGNWLEFYAEALELDVWTSSAVSSARKNQFGVWDIIVDRAGMQCVLRARHLIFATGIGDGLAQIPSYPGMNIFKGQILHSTQHKRAADHAGKKVVIIGACTSAHDIAADCYEHAVDVTIHQRSSTYVMSQKNGWNRMLRPLYWEGGPPTEIADRFNASFPHLMGIELNRRMVQVIAEDDKDTLNGLRNVGFKLNMGTMDAGLPISTLDRGGGFYLDVGASQMIIDGKIKLKSDSPLLAFTETGLKFEDGSELPADVVLFATGLGDVRNIVRKVCGDAIGDACKRILGLDAEGEVYGVWRDVGVHGLWYMMGNLTLSRFHSKHLALQIKAMEEGLFGERYSAAE